MLPVCGPTCLRQACHWVDRMVFWRRLANPCLPCGWQELEQKDGCKRRVTHAPAPMTAPSTGLYAYAALGRYGLAHSLGAWGRATVWAHRHEAELIAPFWLRPRIGPYLRRERDKREYFRQFHAGDAISGLQRLWLLGRLPKIDVGAGWPDKESLPPMPVVVVFPNKMTGNEDSFYQLCDEGALLRSKLLAITRQRYVPAAVPGDSVALHVRMGDFRAAAMSEVLGATRNVILPLDWFSDRLHALRAGLGREVPAIIYSDGSDADLEPLLALPSVVRARRREAIGDLLAMGQSAVVISSGSNFSLWGAFLGGAARLCHPAQMLAQMYSDPHREIESAPGSVLPALFLDAVEARLNGRCPSLQCLGQVGGAGD